jgi:class 3 adenylate cyclase/tetratricopeptide (TPR) repeat protein
VRCPECGRTNADAVSDCAHCGAVLSDRATSSTNESTDRQHQLTRAQEDILRLRRYIPSVVAEGILHDQERLRGERREIAVLFADAVDFTRLSASLDAESVFNLINDLLSRLVECVHRYDGMVDKFTGDGLMAVFGAPIAHESDPELAVRAALDMQKRAAEFEPIARAQLGAPLKIRIGVHSGPVIAGILGTREQAAYTVIGETVNLAARLEASASPGSILVSSRVYRQTRALFNFRSLGTAQLKGVDQPVRVYEARGDRAVPLPTRGVTGVESIFLGRDAEFSQLTGALEGFLDDGQGRLAVIQGEAGMGKSRLVSECLSTVDGDRVAVWWGHGLPYAQGVGYGVFRSLMQNALHGHPAGTAWDEMISPAMRPFLRQMLEQPLTTDDRATLRNLEPERIKQLTTLAMREWLLVNARQRPILLVMEDFHWADDLSRDMLESLVNLAQDAPVFFCVITRPTPETPLDLPGLSEKEPASSPTMLFLSLEPLSPEHSRSLLAHLIDLGDLTDRMIDTILGRAQGIPFYIEEFVRMLVEKDILRLGEERWEVASSVALEALEVPTTLRGLMMARVDRLPQDLQHVLRNAAVIGLQFSAQLLEEVEHRIRGTTSVEPSLDRLCDLGLLVERPEAGEQVYAFRHILTQETIYNSLLRSRRPEMHRTVAECIEQLYAEDLSSQVEVLAFHYDQARVRDKALRYALLAGDRARARFANREAIEYYSRALQLSQHLSGHERERWEAAVGLGEVEQHIGEYEEAIALYKAALEDWGEASAEARAQVMLKMGQVWDKRGELEEAEGWLRQGLAELDRVGMAYPGLRAESYSELGWLSLRRGDLSAAQDWLGRGLELVEDTEHYDVLSSILNRLGGVHFHRGTWQPATMCVERALELREQLGDIVGMARSFNNLGILKKTSGDWEGALADYRRSVELHDQIGDVEGLALAHTNLGILHTERGEWDKAEENLRRSLEIAQEIDHPYELAQAYKNLGRLNLLKGRWEESARHLDVAIPMYNEAGAEAHLNLNDAYYLQCRLYLNQNDIDQAEIWAQRSHDLLQKIISSEDDESVEWGRYEQLIGRIARARGDLEAARRHLERSAEILRASGAPIDVGRAAYWSGIVSLELGREEQAQERLREAERIFGRLGAKADLERVGAQLRKLKE